MGACDVVSVDSAARSRAFCALPYRLYRNDPNWVAPLRGEERRRWSLEHNASLRRRPHARFLAMRDGRAVGRVAAFDDPGFARWDPRAGFFGFFECESDPETAAGLLQAAAAWLRARGRARMLGPVNVSTHDEVGLLVEGFSEPPRVLCPYNPPGYAALMAAAGLRPVRDYTAFEWRAGQRPAPAVERLARRLGHPGSGVTVRPVDPADFDREVDTMHALYNASFDGVWGFVPITRDEFRERAHGFRAFYRPDLALIAELRGRPAGFALLLPDVYRALAPLRGRLLPFGWLRLARAMRHLREARFVLLGVLPELAGRGLGVVLARAAVDAVERAGITRCEVSLVQDANTEMMRVISAFGCRHVRTYRLFGRDPDAERPA